MGTRSLHAGTRYLCPLSLVQLFQTEITISKNIFNILFYLLLYLTILFLLNPLVSKDRLFFHHGDVTFFFVWSIKVISAPERKEKQLLLLFFRETETKLIN